MLFLPSEPPVMKDPGNSSEDESSKPAQDATSYSLFQRAREGDEQAWEDIKLVFERIVKWHCWRKALRNEQDVQEIIQNALIALYKKLPTFEKKREVGGFRSWLRETTLNLIRDYRRKTAKEPQGAGGSTAVKRLANVPAPSEKPLPEEEETEPHEKPLSKEEDEIEYGILVQRALEVLAKKFGPKALEVCREYLVKKRAAKDVAADLGMKADNVYVIAFRVKKCLQEFLKDAGEKD